MSETIIPTANEDLCVTIGRFVLAAQTKINDEWKRMNFTHSKPPTLKIRSNKARRFLSIDRIDDGRDTGFIHCFIDLTGGLHLGVMNRKGDVLKPASWKSPAKHARGNVYNEDFGASGVGAWGATYLR